MKSSVNVLLCDAIGIAFCLTQEAEDSFCGCLLCIVRATVVPGAALSQRRRGKTPLHKNAETSAVLLHGILNELLNMHRSCQ